MASKSKLLIGIDLGGTSVRVGFFTDAMQEIDSVTLRTRVADGPMAVVGDIAEHIAALLNRHSLVGLDADIGIGSPGPLDLRNGTLGILPNFPGWDGFALRQSLASATNFPVYLDCDANAAALAEWQLGAGKQAGVYSLAMITLGTGVGSGIVLQGKLWHGIVGMAGEVGHISVEPLGPPCTCGSRGCLEMYASSKGLVRAAVAAAAKPDCSADLKSLVAGDAAFSAHDLARLAHRGDDSAMELFENLGSYLGRGVAALINTLDLPIIVIGGGVASAWDLFAPSMFEAVRAYSNVYRLSEPSQVERLERDRPFICRAALGPAAGLLGAALLPQLAQMMPAVGVS